MRSCKLLLLFHSFLLHSVATVFRIANWDLILIVLYMRLNVIFNIRKIATLPMGEGGLNAICAVPTPPLTLNETILICRSITTSLDILI